MIGNSTKKLDQSQTAVQRAGFGQGVRASRAIFSYAKALRIARRSRKAGFPRYRTGYRLFCSGGGGRLRWGRAA